MVKYVKNSNVSNTISKRKTSLKEHFLKEQISYTIENFYRYKGTFKIGKMLCWCRPSFDTLVDNMGIKLLDLDLQEQIKFCR